MVQIMTRPTCASKERDYSVHIKAWPLLLFIGTDGD